MPDNTINIKITGNSSSAAAALNQGADAGKQFLDALNKIAPGLQSGQAAEQAFTGALKQLADTVANFQSGLEAIPERLEKIGESFHHVAGTAHETSDALGKVEHSAELREMQLSIREGIENPLGAAKQAAESFLLSFGTTGLVATGLLAIAGAATEVALHTAELGHEYTVLGGELSIAPERAERLSRTFKLLGADAGSLIMANRTLSRVLSDGGEASRKLREDLEAQGVQLRDLSTGAYKPFDQLVLEIVSTLSKSTNTNEANRLGAEALGRTYLRLAGIARELPEAFEAASKGGLSDKEIELTNKYEFGWQKIKLKLQDVVNTTGVWLIQLDKAAGKLDKAAGTELFKERKPTTYAGKTLAGLGGEHPSYTPQAPAIAPTQLSNYGATVAGTAAVKNALRPLGGEAEVLQKKFADLQKELGQYDRNALSVVTSSGKTVGALVAESEALRGQIEAIKAKDVALSLNEDTIKNAAKNATAGVEFEKKVYEDRQKIADIGAIELVKLDAKNAQARRDQMVSFANQELAIEKDSIAKQIALQKTALTQAPDQEKRITATKAIADLKQRETEATQKFKNAELAANTALAEDQAKLVEYYKKQELEWNKIQEEATNLSNEIMGGWAKEQKTRLDEVAVAARESQNTQAKDAVKTTRKRLEDDRDSRLKQISDATAGGGDIAAARGYQQRILTVQEYDAEILKTIEDLGALAIAEGKAKDEESNKKYFDKQVEQGVMSREQADTTIALGGPGVTHAGEETARANAAKATTDYINQERKSLDSLNADFQKNIGSQFFGHLNTGFQGAMQSWISGTKTFGQAWAQMGQKMVADMLTNLAMIGVKFAETALKNLVIHTITTEQQVAVTAAGAAQTVAISATTSLHQLTHSAAVAAGKAWSALADIPIIGPALGAAAAAATYAGVLALGVFEQGGIVGNQKQLALLHPHEMVLPANVSKSVQNMSSGKGGDGGDGGETHQHLHYHASPGENPQSIKNNEAEFLKMARKLMRNGKLAPA